jgi:hypothetical protein
MIDVSEVLDDTDFTQTVTRIQRNETINQYGESVLTSVTSQIVASITSPSAQDLLRFDDSTAYKDAILVITKVRLNSASFGGQPDIIQYHGNNYIVRTTNNFNDFGFVVAHCSLMDLQEAESW